MFRILESIELQGWREQPIDMPLVPWLNCPCDGTELKTVAAIVGDDGKSVRVGCCPSCGYMGYQDRPTPEWFTQFYAQDWDRNSNVQGFINSIRELGYNPPPHPLVDSVRAIPFNPEAKVFEMGTGYGRGLSSLRDIGYKHLSGVEACPHRARVACEGFGLDVRSESLEDHAGGPYDVILSFHVLEHCYDPDAIVAKLASLQTIGGHVVIGVPNCAGEPTMGVLTFLPHLHSFTTTGLARLLERHGYRLVESRVSHEGQQVVAEYVGRPMESKGGDCFEAGLRKISFGTGSAGEYQIWPMHQDQPVSGPLAMWQTVAKNCAADKPRCLRVEPIRTRLTDAPVEIQWAGPLRLFVK